MNSLKDIETIAYVVGEANDEFKLRDIILDGVQDDELLIEMKYSGICHSDFVVQSSAITSYTFPAILGHEGAGYVRTIGSNVEKKDINIGDFVLLSFSFCGKCKQCRNGHPAHCDHFAGIREDGSSPARLKDGGQMVQGQFFGQSSFAKMSVVRQSCVVKYSGDPEKAAIFAACGCGFQTGAGTVMNVLQPDEDDAIAIFGMGSVGLTALMAAKHLGLRQIIAVDIVESRLELAKELGATHVVNSNLTPDFVAEIKKVAEKGLDFCIDCAGHNAVVEGMLECLARPGTAVSIGVPNPGKKIAVDPFAFLAGWKRWITSIEGDVVPQKFIPELVNMQKKGQFPIEKICKTYPYQQMQQAVKDTHEGKVVKAVIQWS